MNTIAAGPAGVLYVIDRGEIKKVTGGIVTTFAKNVGDGLMGMSVDAAGNVLVAASGSRSIIRITADGKRSVVARSPAPWGPSGFVFAYGDLWILEYSTSNAVRVRRIRSDKSVSVY